MAKKKNENTTTLKKEIGKLSTKGKTIMAVLLALFLSALLFLFVFTLLESITPESVTDEEYELLLSKLDKREWTIPAESVKTLSSFLDGYVPEKAQTKKSLSTLIIVLSDKESEQSLYFSYRSGKISGFISSTLFTLYHSTLKGGKSRALTLIGGGEKIVFYEAE